MDMVPERPTDDDAAIAALDQAYEVLVAIGRRARARDAALPASTPVPTARPIAPTAPTPPSTPKRKRSPRRLAKWEAHWQAEDVTAEGAR